MGYKIIKTTTKKGETMRWNRNYPKLGATKSMDRFAWIPT